MAASPCLGEDGPLQKTFRMARVVLGCGRGDRDACTKPAPWHVTARVEQGDDTLSSGGCGDMAAGGRASVLYTP